MVDSMNILLTNSISVCLFFLKFPPFLLQMFTALSEGILRTELEAWKSSRIIPFLWVFHHTATSPPALHIQQHFPKILSRKQIVWEFKEKVKLSKVIVTPQYFSNCNKKRKLVWKQQCWRAKPEIKKYFIEIYVFNFCSARLCCINNIKVNV